MAHKKTKNIREIVRRWTPLPDVLRKAKSGKQLTQFEFNDIRGYLRKSQRYDEADADKIYVIYRKARDIVDVYGYAPPVWVGICYDGSEIESTDREALVDVMYGIIDEIPEKARVK